MEKLAFLLLLFNITARAQAYPRFDRNQEIKFNIGHFLATANVDFSYEYFFAEDTSIGATIYFDNDGSDYNGNFGIGPNLRAYFGYDPRSGFFAEAFGLYYTGEEIIQASDPIRRNHGYNTFALGLGLGNKWVTRSERFSLEIFGGLGRNLFIEEFQNSFMYRAGLSVGFRF